MVIFDITARYNAFEAFLYDFFAAPAVFGTISPFMDAILGHAADGSSLLDVGCGGGQLAIALKKVRGDLDVAGIDLSLSQIKRARRRAAHAGADVRLTQASALELPFTDGSFDLVYSVDCLKHWPDRLKGLSECIRVTKPGGTLLITEIDRKSSLKNGMGFAARHRLPAFLKPVSVVPFFMFAVLRSVSRDEARALAGRFPLRDLSVEPGPSGVNWTLKAVKLPLPAPTGTSLPEQP